MGKLPYVVGIVVVLAVVWAMKPSSSMDVMAIPGASNGKQFVSHNPFEGSGANSPARAKIEALIAGDADLRGFVQFDSYQANTLTGVGMSPEATERLLAACENAKNEMPKLDCRVILAPGWTPNRVTGHVRDAYGKPVAGARLSLRVVDAYVAPATKQARMRFGPMSVNASMAESVGPSEWFATTDAQGFFSVCHLPSSDKPVRVTAQSPAGQGAAFANLPTGEVTITLEE